MGLRRLVVRAVRVCARLVAPPVLAAGIVVPAWLWDPEGVQSTLHSSTGLATVGAGVAVVVVCLAVRLCTGSEFAGWYAEAALPAAALCLVLLPLAGPAAPAPASLRTAPPDRATPDRATPDRATPPGAHGADQGYRLQAETGPETSSGSGVDRPVRRPAAHRIGRPPDVFAEVAAVRARPDRQADLAGVVGRSVEGSVRLVGTGTRGRPMVEIQDLRAGPPGSRLEVHLAPGSQGQALPRTELGVARAGRSVQAYTLPPGVRLTGPVTVLLWQPDPGVLLASASLAPEPPKPRSGDRPAGGHRR